MVTFKMIVVGILMLSTIGVLPIPINISSVGTDSTDLLADDQDVIGTKTKTDCLTVKELSKCITDSTIAKVLTLTPTPNSTATSNRTPTEQHSNPGLEEHYSALKRLTNDVPTVSLANCDGFMTSAHCTTVPVLSKPNVNTATTNTLQERTRIPVCTGSLASINTAATGSLQQHTFNVVPTRSLVILNAATTESLQEQTLIPICTGSQVGVDIATTVSRQQHTSNVVTTGSQVVLSVATTQPLQDGVLDLTPIVSLASRDLANSSWETSLNDLKDENRAPSDNRSPVHGRVTYASVAYLAMFIISGMMITRLRTLRLSEWRSMTLINVLTTLIYILGILFIYSAGMLIDGWDLTSERLCRGAIYLCLIFYIGCKVIMYILLVERAHLLRHVSRGKDVVFLVGIAVLICGFGPIAVIAFKEPVTGLSAVDGMCRIGLPLAVTITLLAYDTTINVLMVGMYILLGWPYMRGRGSSGVWLRALRLNTNTAGLSQGLILELLICKGVYGACLVVLPTVANLAVLYKIHGREQGWLCFTICTIDVSWSVMIIHWLTAKPEGLENAPPGTYLEMG